ncbi:MAG: 2-polyprenylphenol 6-hydroxylase [Pseudomonadota bacterium]
MKAEWRYFLRIARQILRHRLDRLIPVDVIPSRLARGLLRILQRVLPAPKEAPPASLRQAFIDLGPVYIKLGQLLSTRRDLIPPDVADALAELQDRVPPIPGFAVEDFVSAQLQQPVSEVFSELAPTPLASASIAQVHAAKLVNGDAVVVKLVRPGIADRIKEDMALLKLLAAQVTRWVPDAHRLQLPQVCADHERVLLQELDMFAESRNQIQLRRNFADSPLLYVPKVYSDYTRPQMFVMERVYGVPVNQLETLHEHEVDLRVLAHKGVETFFTQVFEHNFFHADMHPGNILVDTSNPADPRYIALDCAIIGTLTEADQNYLAQNLLAFFHRDYRRVVDLHLESGWIPADTDAEQFEAVIREVCEPIFAKPLAEISFGEFVLTLFQTAGQFNMEIQPQLVLLQKTLLYIEGVGRQLYPQLDLWETAQPFMDAWAARHLGPAAVVNEWVNAGPQVWQQLSRLPQTLLRSETELRQLRSDIHKQHQTITRIESGISRQQRHRRFKQVAGIALVVASGWMLWQPLSAGLASGDITMLAGVISALLGSALLVRA